jgi:SAM-dependent methyltransferase
MLGTEVSRCRSCNAATLVPVLDLGSTPIANALVPAERLAEPEATYPLVVVFCTSCTLVQLGYELPSDAIFGEEYPYFSSFSAAFCDHAAAHVAGLLATRPLSAESLVVEVASNDGYLLRNVVAAGVRALGIDPAPQPAQAAIEAGVPTIIGFFGVAAAEAIVAEHGHADVIVANNVMAHVPDLNDFVGGFATLLADDGVLTVENPWVHDMIEHVEFDTVYHEHYCYFSCIAVDALMQRHGLHLNDIEYFPDLHGGTLRWYVERRPRRTARCQELIDRERSAGLHTTAYYESFASRVVACQQSLRDTVTELCAAGRRVAAYGAAAKGATMLNSAGIGADQIEYVVDRNVHKQGKWVPGCRLPIRPVEVLAETPPDDVIVLAWNFADEIVRQQHAFAEQGGTFWVPVPLAHRYPPS